MALAFSDLTKGERAAALALLYPGGQGKADEAGKTSAETAEVSERRLRVARQVGRHSLELLHAVRDGRARCGITRESPCA
jgi:hypothetical protein